MADARWPELDDSATRTLLVPLGSLEQHGRHLPLDTDTRIAAAVAHRAAAGPGQLVAPPMPYGASGEHETFPGTVSIGSDALHAQLVELGRSATRWASRIAFVNGHGGNATALAGAAALLRYEGRDVGWFGVAVPGGDGHAGHTETSIMLALAADTVRLDLARPGATAPLAELMAAMREGSVRAVSGSGVLGDPTGADAEQGNAMLDAVVARLRTVLHRWQPDERGRLR